MWKPSTTPDDVLMHSAKGSTWKNHKYLKKIGNAYIYAKAASASKKNSKKAYKEFEKQYHEGGGYIKEFNKRIEDRIKERRKGAPREYYKDTSVYYDQEKAADEFLKSERNAQYAKKYSDKAKGELSSLKKEMTSNINNKVSSAMKKLKNKLVTEETTVTDAYTGKKRKTNMKANYKKSKKKIRIKK